ncbi:hypothetical protein [Ruminiclostridium papyrosolvens]|uniref:Uncharacterized protein n=1 Tax=Ruminiclostridium papyrosolvens C7 TaxID=1330534 RepID=U4R2E6_9FIRM|nr:hypothetical protein [Ruminiclostridium papyrosolvens]EPR12380.1 hypothetical protein L323_08795 [Ruminiclostridium papyrosolvens C7]
MIERTVYQCEHCKKYKRTPRIYFKSTDTYTHEQFCFYNEKNKTCLTCKFNTREQHEGLPVKGIGCEFDLLDFTKYFSLSDVIKRDCDHWESRLKQRSEDDGN